jgi:phage shock protein PspC (stress-responsive transcriptional regulator)
MMRRSCDVQAVDMTTIPTDMTPPADPPPPDYPSTGEPPSDPPPPSAPERRLRRSDNSPIAGVASGLAGYFGIDPGLVRFGFVIAAFLGGFGLFAYIAGWALIPSERDPDPRPIALNSGVGAILIGGIAAIAALSSTFGPWGSTPVFAGIVVPIVLIGIGIHLLNQRPAPAGPGRPRPGGTVGAPPSGGVAPSPVWGSVFVEPTPRPREARPPVTAVTLAIAAVAIGTLVIVDQLTSVDIGATALFGVATAVIGAGLIASAFLGRALGLWLIAPLVLLGLAVSPIIDDLPDGGVGPVTYRPTSAAEVESEYRLTAGEFLLDLRAVDFVDDTAITIDVGAGDVVIEVPDGVTLVLDATARVGSVVGPDNVSRDGLRVEVDRRYPAREAAPVLTIDAHVDFGAIEVNRG